MSVAGTPRLSQGNVQRRSWERDARMASSSGDRGRDALASDWRETVLSRGICDTVQLAGSVPAMTPVMTCDVCLGALVWDFADLCFGVLLVGGGVMSLGGGDPR